MGELLVFKPYLRRTLILCLSLWLRWPKRSLRGSAWFSKYRYPLVCHVDLKALHILVLAASVRTRRELATSSRYLGTRGVMISIIIIFPVSMQFFSFRAICSFSFARCCQRLCGSLNYTRGPGKRTARQGAAYWKHPLWHWNGFTIGYSPVLYFTFRMLSVSLWLNVASVHASVVLWYPWW